MHAIEDALIDAILTAPGDDGPRFVYADWLLSRERSLAVRVGRALFEHGLLHTLTLEGGALEAPALEELLADQRLRVLRRLEIGALQPFRALLERARFDGLLSLVAPAEALEVLATRALPRLYTLELDWDGRSPWHALQARSLRQLTLCDLSADPSRPTPGAELFTSGLVQGLERLRSQRSPRAGDSLEGWPRFELWLQRLLEAGSPVPLVEICSGSCTLRMQRGESGYALELSGPLLRHPLGADTVACRSLLSSLSHLPSRGIERLTLRGEVHPQTLAAIRTAAGRHLEAAQRPA